MLQFIQFSNIDGFNILGASFFCIIMFIKQFHRFNRLYYRIIYVNLFCTLILNHVNAFAFVSSAPLEDLLIKSDPKTALVEIEKQKKDLSPDDYLLLKSNAFILMRNWKDAESILEPLYNANPRNAIIANNYSVALWGNGKKDQAKTVLEKNLLLNSPAFRNLRKIYLSNAADAYSKALDGKPNGFKLDLATSTTTGRDVELKPIAPPVVPPVVADINKSRSDKSKEESSKHEISSDNKSITKDSANDPNQAPKNKVSQDKDPIPPEYAVIDANIKGWASAWSNKKIKSYLSFYSNNYRPEGGMSYSEWVNQRTQRVTKPGPIDVKVEILSYSGADKKVIVKIRQKYTSINLKGDLNKFLEFTNEQGKWLITREYNK